MVHPYHVAWIDFTTIRFPEMHIEAAMRHPSGILLVVPEHGKRNRAEQNAKVVWACGRKLVSTWNDDLKGWVIQRKECVR